MQNLFEEVIACIDPSKILLSKERISKSIDSFSGYYDPFFGSMFKLLVIAICMYTIFLFPNCSVSTFFENECFFCPLVEKKNMSLFSCIFFLLLLISWVAYIQLLFDGISLFPEKL